MASVLSNWWGNKILADTLTKYGAWVGLHIEDPTVLASPSSEVTGDGYIRQKSAFSAASSKTVASTTKLTFALMPTCTITHISLWDSQVSGNMYCYVVLATPIPIASSSHFVASAGDIAVTL